LSLFAAFDNSRIFLLFVRKIEKVTLITFTKDKKNSVAKVLVAVGQRPDGG